jgi:hypothetical protein
LRRPAHKIRLEKNSTRLKADFRFWPLGTVF